MIRLEDLTSEEQRIALIEEGKEAWRADHKGRMGIFLEDNVTRLKAIERWYPYCYLLITEHYAQILERGNDIGGLASMVNHIIEQHVPVSCIDEVRLSWC